MTDFIKIIITKYLGNSSYKKNVAILVSGRVMAQAIPILLTPVLTRIYSPEDYGIFAVFNTLVSLVAMVSNGRYCLAIMLPTDESKARDLVLLSSLLSFLTALIFFAFLLIGGNQFFTFLNAEILVKYTGIIALSILVIGFYEALFYYALRQKKYKTLSINLIVQAGVLVVSRLGFGLMGYTEMGLIASFFLSYAISYVLFIFRVEGYRGILVPVSTVKKYNTLLSRYRNFPIYSLAADTLQNLAFLSPSIFLNKIFGSTSAGYYSMSDKILGSPIWFVTTSVGDVFKQEASEQFRQKGNCNGVFVKTAKSLFLLGIIPFVILFVFAPTVVPIILGENWESVGIYIRILSVMYFARFVVSPVSYIVYIVEKNSLNIIFQGLKVLSIVVAFVVGYYYENLMFGLLLWSVLSTLAYVVIYMISSKLAKNSKYREDTSLDPRYDN